MFIQPAKKMSPSILVWKKKEIMWHITVTVITVIVKWTILQFLLMEVRKPLANFLWMQSLNNPWKYKKTYLFGSFSELPQGAICKK